VVEKPSNEKGQSEFVGMNNDFLSNRKAPLCASDKEDFSVKKNYKKQTPGHTSEQILAVQLDAGTPGGSS